ncbi:MAG: AAA family ATPase [Lachnospiraceae bacterium]|jgi:putative ATP-dependent endonuclease of OLD family|nr:AAA family ATPase [Lachnospiraceae bacterium]MEE3461589.1 AAA family ATPase [Lachnospiraceae bacterium]
MKFTYMHICNFKSINDLEIKDLENAMILVGRNNTGKTSVIDAILVATGNKKPKSRYFMAPDKSINITLTLSITEEDLHFYHDNAIVSRQKDYDSWLSEFYTALPSFKDDAITFTCHINPELEVKYRDGFSKNNTSIPEIFPKIYHLDHSRKIDSFQRDVLSFYDKESYNTLKDDVCMFDKTRKCNRCFNCIGLINKKAPADLNLIEATKLLEYKLYNTNVNAFADKVNFYLHKNGSPFQDVVYDLNFNTNNILNFETRVRNNLRENSGYGPISQMSEGTKSIYALSLLEAYSEEKDVLPCIILVEDPEIFLHPSLQKMASEILYRLSKKNQVIFSTQSPNLIFNFSTKQIKEVILDENYYTTIRPDTDVDRILDDLGYSANDLMNVNFVFIVEGKQDFNRLPLLLEKYYSEIYDDDGKLQRISIIPVNSCTNIKTYANLKYINKLYLKDQFLMIRDSDGKNPVYLKKQLCNYYRKRSAEDVGNLPDVKPQNVLILKYYSFENYFLDPSVMAKIGVINREEDFYRILYEKYKDYLYKLTSFRRLVKTKGLKIRGPEDIRSNIEDIKIYVRGHNLFDIFYGKYHGGEKEQEILKEYIDIAPRSTFQDIFDAIDSFVYFENRKKN